MKILQEKESAFKLFIQDFIIPISPFVIVGIIGIISPHLLQWISEILR